MHLGKHLLRLAWDEKSAGPYRIAASKICCSILLVIQLLLLRLLLRLLLCLLLRLLLLLLLFLLLRLLLLFLLFLLSCPAVHQVIYRLSMAQQTLTSLSSELTNCRAKMEGK